MGSVDLKVGGVVLVTIGLYTLVANVIPQIESGVPLTVAFGADVTAEELVSAGEILYHGTGGCTACHAESPGSRGPNLITDYSGLGPIGERCGSRVTGLACKDYLYQALVQPQLDMVDDYPPIMPPTDRTMTQQQIWALVAYLEAQGGEVTVSAADIAAEPTPAAAPGDLPGAPGIASLEPTDILDQLCVMCHVLGDTGVELGPPLSDIGARRSAEEIRLAILDPPSVVTPGYEDFVGLMPTNFGDRLTGTQLEFLVQYLSGLD